MTKLPREYAIDWLRVLAIFVFHRGAPYATGDWHLNAGGIGHHCVAERSPVEPA